MSKTVIGLSFGNTNSSIAFLKEGKVEVIVNQYGDRVIPSMISFAHGDLYHGQQAKEQLIRNAENTVAFFRDFVGKNYGDIDASVCAGSAKPLKTEDGVAFSVITNPDEPAKLLSIDEVIVYHFTKLREAATEYIGSRIDGTVLTVPSDFTFSQRKKLAELAEQSGLPVKQIVNEDSAAALAHMSRPDVSGSGDRLIAVVDIGGTRSDGAVIAVNGGLMTVLATLHDRRLGGIYIDKLMVEHLAHGFQQKFSVDARKDRKAMAKLTREAELIKRTLSNSTSATYGIESVTQGIDFSGTLNRLKFELICRPVFNHVSAFVEKLLKKAAVDPLDIEEVLLVGGSSWIPKVSQVVGNLFVESTLIRSPARDPKSLDPDELIARGAALQASIIAELDDKMIADCLQPVVVNGPHLTKEIGYIEAEGSIKTILGKHTLLPVRRTVNIKANGPSYIKLVEVDSKFVTRFVKPEKQESEHSGSEDEEEEYEVRERQLLASKTLAEISINASDSIELAIEVDQDAKVSLTASSADEKVVLGEPSK